LNLLKCLKFLFLFEGLFCFQDGLEFRRQEVIQSRSSFRQRLSLCILKECLIACLRLQREELRLQGITQRQFKVDHQITILHLLKVKQMLILLLSSTVVHITVAVVALDTFPEFGGGHGIRFNHVLESVELQFQDYGWGLCEEVVLPLLVVNELFDAQDCTFTVDLVDSLLREMDQVTLTHD